MSESPRTLLSSPAWDALTDEQRVLLTLVAADVSVDDQIDVDHVQILYRGLPIHSLATHLDPRVADPVLSAIVAIDRAAREALAPFELRERVSEMGEEAFSALLDKARASAPTAPESSSLVAWDRYREAQTTTPRGLLLGVDVEPAVRPTEPSGSGEDLDFLAFDSATIPPGCVQTVYAHPYEPFLARRLAITVPPEVARLLKISMTGARRTLFDLVSADNFLVRVPSDPTRPIERGARIRDTNLYPSMPMSLTVENQSVLVVSFSAILQGRSLT